METQVDDWVAARARARRAVRFNLFVVAPATVLLGTAAAYLADRTTSGSARYLATFGFLTLLMAPMALLLARHMVREQGVTFAVLDRLTDRWKEAVETARREAATREVQARAQKLESRLANALDMAEGEPEVIDVIERSFGSIATGSPVELLLADNSHAHLVRMAASRSPSVSGCGVDSPDHCPAARRAQVQRFPDSDALDACPKLRDRPEGSMSALCVPVSIMGRTVGVIHATGEQHHVFEESTAQDMETLAKLAGARIGLLRVMSETALQAATDSLTGLLNRRSFERQYSTASRQSTGAGVAMADLDHFKILNDKYGHETGDRALRLFSQVLSACVRSGDLVGRHGGEEFVLAVFGCQVDKVRAILDGIRERLDAAITVAGLPRFTVSFGLVTAGPAEDLPAVLARADVALFQAKRNGRDQVIVHDVGGEVVAATPTFEDDDNLAVVQPIHRREPAALDGRQTSEL